MMVDTKVSKKLMECLRTTDGRKNMNLRDKRYLFRLCIAVTSNALTIIHVWYYSLSMQNQDLKNLNSEAFDQAVNEVRDKFAS